MIKVLLLGDQCQDIYQYGIVTRISPEAPVPVFMHRHQDVRPGMAGNVLANLNALGVKVDWKFGAKQSIKTRVIDLKSQQHLLRVDHDIESPPIILDGTDLAGYNAIVISDYNKGSITTELICEIRHRYTGPIFLDTKKTDLKNFKNVWIKINEPEYQKLTSANDHLIVTLGDQGARYQGQVFATRHIEVVDVTGAGDTFLAALTYWYCMSASITDAIRFANAAAGVTVEKHGVYAPTIKEFISDIVT